MRLKQISERGGGCCQSETQRPGHHKGGKGGTIELLKSINAQHCGDIVLQSCRFIFLQVVPVSQTRPIQDHCLDLVGKFTDISETQVSSLASQWVNPVRTVANQGGPGTNIEGRVSKAERKGSPLTNTGDSWRRRPLPSTKHSSHPFGENKSKTLLP